MIFLYTLKYKYNPLKYINKTKVSFKSNFYLSFTHLPSSLLLILFHGTLLLFSIIINHHRNHPFELQTGRTVTHSKSSLQR
jgi:hypothetical protein